MTHPRALRGPSAVPFAIGWAAALVGAIAAWHYHGLGLTLTHYDARGHLIVARRIFDSITPGWQQIGAVWLPLPHLLNAIPVQVDFFYRTGASAVAISIAAFAVATGAIAWIVLSLTGSSGAAIAAASVFALNPNVLYLQSTPMTEPLLMALLTVAIGLLLAMVGAEPAPPAAPAPPVAAGRASSAPAVTGCAFALACLTRYEAWPVTAVAIATTTWIDWRGGRRFADACRGTGLIAIYPALAIAGFAIFSRVVIGQWFVSGDFFVPENKALGDSMMALKEIGWGVQMLGGRLLVLVGAAGAAVLAARGFFRRRSSSAILPLALLAMAAIPWAAFVEGHPFRIRYMVPLVAIEAIGAGLVAGAIPRRRAQMLGATALLAVAAYELSPFDGRAPMVLEAQWDRPNLPERARVTACIGRLEPGAKIMASMGSLGHYMQEASAAGFAIRDFLHEGNGDIWLAALERPQLVADWLLIEEKAEGGDMLAHIARERPAFLDGYQRVCEGAGLVLYRRVEGKPEDTEYTD
ncbi:MAG: hypothetical protein DMF93_10410 [Acidobacteria bacterium]|nr:MAG: hypothetical protein DMF93_10410 [Acidobacteriota bacterium]